MHSSWVTSKSVLRLLAHDITYTVDIYHHAPISIVTSIAPHWFLKTFFGVSIVVQPRFIQC